VPHHAYRFSAEIHNKRPYPRIQCHGLNAVTLLDNQFCGVSSALGIVWPAPLSVSHHRQAKSAQSCRGAKQVHPSREGPSACIHPAERNHTQSHQAATPVQYGTNAALPALVGEAKTEAHMAGSLAGSLILVVEDEPLVALDVSDCFQQAGATTIISRTLEDALVKAELPDLTAAVIDHALHDGLTTSDVCAKLKERNVPFVIYSGYSKLEGECAIGMLVHKPTTPAILLAAMKGVLAQRRLS
jgi:CheY-like chemotaxis protein